MTRFWQTIIFLSLSLILSACGTNQRALKDGAPTHVPNVKNIPNAVPKVLPRSRYGNPVSYEEFGKRYYTLKTSRGFHERGIASWYGTKFHGRRTSSGEPYNMLAMTAAHPTLPLPTFVRVTNLKNGKTIIVKVNDRGPFKKNRIIDLSYVAAKKLDMLKKGTAPVEISAIDPQHYHRRQTKQRYVQPESHHPHYYLQIGAYASRDNAKAMAQRVKSITHQRTLIEKIKKYNSPIYRVQVGPLNNIQASDRIFAALEDAGLGRPWTIIK